MNLKHNVIPNGVKTEIILAILVAKSVYETAGHSLTVTSIADGKHSKTSLHYVGYAVDLRTRMLSEDEKHDIAREIRERLTTDYDVVVEDTHIHIEYQPKRP